MRLLKSLWPIGRKSVVEVNTPLGRVIGYQLMGEGALTDRRMIESAVLMACIRVLCDSISILPFKIYMDGDKTKADNSNHPLWRVLNRRPNPFQTPSVFKSQIILHMFLKGNYYGWINRVNGKIVDIIPMNPDYITVEQLPNWELQYTWRRDGKAEMKLAAKDVLHIPGFVFDGATGMAMQQLAGKIVSLDNLMQDHAKSFFENQAVPGQVAITLPVGMNEEKAGKIKEQIQQNYTAANKHKAMVLYGGMDVKSIAVNATDAQFIEQNKEVAIKICGLLGVPPHKIGILDRATFSNIEHQSIEFVTNGMLPKAIRIEEEINLKALGPDSGLFCKLNEKALLRGDSKTQADVLDIERRNGVINANEWRDLLDMPPRTDAAGNEYLTPVNMAPAQQQPTKTVTTQN